MHLGLANMDEKGKRRAIPATHNNGDYENGYRRRSEQNMPVEGTSRKVSVVDQGPGRVVVKACCPGDIASTHALQVWGTDRSTQTLHLMIHPAQANSGKLTQKDVSKLAQGEPWEQMFSNIALQEYMVGLATLVLDLDDTQCHTHTVLEAMLTLMPQLLRMTNLKEIVLLSGFLLDKEICEFYESLKAKYDIAVVKNAQRGNSIKIGSGRGHELSLVIATRQVIGKVSPQKMIGHLDILTEILNRTTWKWKRYTSADTLSQSAAVRSKDSSKILCLPWNKVKSNIPKGVPRISFSGPSEIILATPGSIVHLEAHIESGYSDCKIIWYHDGKEMMPKPGIAIETTPTSTKLVIAQCGTEATGTYSLRAQTPKGYNEISVYLELKGINYQYDLTSPQPEEYEQTELQDVPTLAYDHVRRQKLVVQPGKPAELAVRVEGNTNVTIEWFRADNIIELPNTNIEVATAKNTASLVIRKCTEKDAGEYSVRASNKYGDHQVFFHLYVLDDKNPDENLPPPPADIRRMRLKSGEDGKLHHLKAETCVSVPSGAILTTEQISSQVLDDMAALKEGLPDNEFPAGPGIKLKRSRSEEVFHKPVKMTMRHFIIDEKVRNNIKVYCRSNKGKLKVVKRDDNYSEFNSEAQWTKSEHEVCCVGLHYVTVYTNHFSDFFCSTHGGPECASVADLSLYMSIESFYGGHIVKLRPVITIGCSSLKIFEGRIRIDDKMERKTEQTIVINNPGKCVTISTKLMSDQLVEYLVEGAYKGGMCPEVTIGEDKLQGSNGYLREGSHLPKVINLPDIQLRTDQGCMFSGSMPVEFKYSDGKVITDEVKFSHNLASNGGKSGASHCPFGRKRKLSTECIWQLLNRQDVVPRLVELLEISSMLLAHLTSILDPDNNDYLANNYKPTTERARKLLSVIAKRGCEAYELFLKALKATNQLGVIDVLSRAEEAFREETSDEDYDEPPRRPQTKAKKKPRNRNAPRDLGEDDDEVFPQQPGKRKQKNLRSVLHCSNGAYSTSGEETPLLGKAVDQVDYRVSRCSCCPCCPCCTIM